MVPGVTRDRHMRSRCRCSMCPAIHTNSRSWLRSSSTHEPSDPPLRVVSVRTFGHARPGNNRTRPGQRGVSPRRLPPPEIRYQKTVSGNRRCRGGRAGQPALRKGQGRPSRTDEGLAPGRGRSPVGSPVGRGRAAASATPHISLNLCQSGEDRESQTSSPLVLSPNTRRGPVRPPAR